LPGLVDAGIVLIKTVGAAANATYAITLSLRKTTA
jgi:hypothetical protein